MEIRLRVDVDIETVARAIHSRYEPLSAIAWDALRPHTRRWLIAAARGAIEAITESFDAGMPIATGDYGWPTKEGAE